MTLAEQELLSKDLEHLWHPCSQMKDYTIFPPQIVTKAEGPYLYLTNSPRLIDAISSWWCKSLGHGHPRLKAALIKQASQFEHVMIANLTHGPIIRLSQQLAQLMPQLNKVMYAGDGSSAVEMALKMSLHSRLITGQPQRTRFMALTGSYHGETCGALSVSDLGLYRRPYEALLTPTHFIQNIPYVSGKDDPLWQDSQVFWPAIECQLNTVADELTAIIIEPILQAAHGMRIYSADFLQRLSRWCKKNEIHLIADEIMTGFGRTGKALACEHANIVPDILCLGKGLTAGWLPMSAVLTTADLYQLFYDDYAKGKAFLHSHTHSGNALATAVAVENLQVLADEQIYEKLPVLERTLKINMEKVAEKTGRLTAIRCIGGVVAADLIAETSQRMGFVVQQEACQRGALLRPLGNTLYWCPPLNITPDVITELAEITINAIDAAFAS